MNAVEKLITIAKSQVGYIEKKSNSHLEDKTANAGANDFTKYAKDLDKLGVYNSKKNGHWWCDMFVDWCFVTAFGMEKAWQMTNQPMGGCGAGCVFSASYYKSMNRFYSEPQPGDQIFFKNNEGVICHTGIVEKIQNSRVYTIEGNTSSDSGVVANGGCVNKKSYLLTNPRIGGYGRPNWFLVSNTYEEGGEMENDEFKKLWLEMRKELQTNNAGNWSEEARNWCVANNIIQGGNVVNGETNYMWSDILTREQMAVLLYRFAKIISKA